jgi:hypothetical protein
MFFSFTGRGSFFLGAAQGYFSGAVGEGIEETCMVHDALLFLLQFHTGSFGAS